jgi:hypothetical protein
MLAVEALRYLKGVCIQVWIMGRTLTGSRYRRWVLAEW